MFWVSPCELTWSSLAFGYHFQNHLWSCCLDLCLWFAWGQGRCCFAAEGLPRCPSQPGAKAPITVSVSSVPLPKCMWRFINLQQTFSGRRAPKASPLRMKLFLPILTLLQNRIWLQHCAGFLIEFPPAQQNQKFFLMLPHAKPPFQDCFYLSFCQNLGHWMVQML